MKLKSLSSRQKKIINKLIKSTDFITIKELAQQLKISKRTVQRELSKLKTFLKELDLNLESKPGVGITINGEEALIAKFEKKLSTPISNRMNLTPKERKTQIIQEFLMGGRFHKLTALAHKFAVTEATISYDLNKVSNWFEMRGLSLVRKQGVGVELEGSETAFRRAVLDFLYENMGEDEILTLIHESEKEQPKDATSNARNKILNFINLDNFEKLEIAVNESLEEIDFDVVNSSYIGLIIHLSLAIKRLQMEETIYIDQDKLTDLKETSEYEVAEKLADKLEDIFDLTVPVEEKGYITMHLKGAKLRKNIDLMDEPLDTEELEVIRLARVLVQEVEKELNVKLVDDFNLISGLVTHLEPALSRLKMGMEIRNPILKHLRLEYRPIFSATKQAASKLEQMINRIIPDAEIGFLTMHIAAAVEKSDDSNCKARVLVVCSSGIGSSKILATRLKKTIKNLEVVDEVSALELKNNQLPKDIDFIVSTIPLEKHQEDTVVVSPILMPDEIEKIRTKINQINLKVKEKKQDNKENKLEDKLATVATISEDIMGIIQNFEIIRLEKGQNYDQLIKQAASTDFLPTDSHPESVYQALKKREEKGATIIPSIKLSLLHARTDGVRQPFIGLISLKKPILIPDSKKEKQEVDRIVVLLAPQELLEEELQLISDFSASIIENQKFYQVVRKGNKEGFRNYLRKLMDDYYKKLVTKGG
ncbi:transcriptional antiterminator [Halobacteroides halobius DSM 5150]|uniref:Transcriptional antiterminator n=1 Tax=Halobacteroides halobius (strain ATCC 35273 / DSM 5150 / MD-1) TaxID=748449 RepID=L0K7I3_HALHC|nr:BglG family transcription antiterminator [Halobacteroides halobius]AGB40289.1 transcriptional antiterminator [Halobacteroides halobius DSM 5150]